MPTKKTTAEVPMTEPVQTPEHPHIKYDYEFGEKRRCHLCGTPEEHMTNDADDVWFATLEDRARHIKECHRDIPVEVQRAKEILGVADLWNSKSPVKEAKFKIPVIDKLVPSVKEKEKQVEDEEIEGNWFKRHKVLGGLLVAAIIYVMYCILMLSKGYTF